MKVSSKVVAGIVKNDRKPSITTAKVLTEKVPPLWPCKTTSNNTKGLFRIAAEAVSVGNFFKVEEGYEKADFRLCKPI